MSYGRDTEELLQLLEHESVYLRDMHVTDLPNLPEGIEQLSCIHLPITKLPPLPSTLKYLRVEGQLTHLPNLPEGLETLTLVCGNTKLPHLPSSLKYLTVYSEQLTELPPLPSSLESLDCRNASITKLPSLPTGLEELNCSNTHITELPSLPTGLKELDCSSTRITKLPPLPTGLKELHCWYCPSIPKRGVDERMEDYISRVREHESRLRCQERCKAVKDDLVMEVMHPRRIERLLEAGGWEVLECF